jgi:hypothetical protein
MSTSFTQRRAGLLLAGFVAINAIVLSPLGDEAFLGIALLGPVATGIVVGLARSDTRLAAATWAVTGVFWLVLDWIVNHEDVAFHAVLALVMAGLVALGAGAGRAARRVARHAAVPQAGQPSRSNVGMADGNNSASSASSSATPTPPL